VFNPDFQPCARFALLETGAGVFAIPCFGDEAGYRVAAGWVDCAGYDAHLWKQRLDWHLWVGQGIGCLKGVGEELLSLVNTMLGCAFVGWREEIDICDQSRVYIAGKTDFNAQ
jgi:hypothetical protein